ncbi:hypothetical protein AAHC03_09866 [Spirometra sp. Aus1]
MGCGNCFHIHSARVHDLGAVTAPNTVTAVDIARPIPVGDVRPGHRQGLEQRLIKTSNSYNLEPLSNGSYATATTEASQTCFVTAKTLPSTFTDFQPLNEECIEKGDFFHCAELSNSDLQKTEAAPRQCLSKVSPHVSVPPIIFKLSGSKVSHSIKESESSTCGGGTVNGKGGASSNHSLPSRLESSHDDVTRKFVFVNSPSPFSSLHTRIAPMKIQDNVDVPETAKTYDICDLNRQLSTAAQEVKDGRIMGDNIDDDKGKKDYKVEDEKAHTFEQEISSGQEALVLVSPVSAEVSAPRENGEGLGSPVTIRERTEHQSLYPAALDLTESCEPMPDHSDSDFDSSLVDDSIADYPQESEVDIASPSIYEQLLSLTGSATVSSAKRKMCADNERTSKAKNSYISSPKIEHIVSTRAAQIDSTETKRSGVPLASNSKKASHPTAETKADSRPPRNPTARPRLKTKSSRIKTLIGCMPDDSEIHAVDFQAETLFSTRSPTLPLVSLERKPSGQPSELKFSVKVRQSNKLNREEIFMQLPNVCEMLSCAGPNLAERVGLPSAMVFLQLASTHNRSGDIRLHLKHPLPSTESNDELLSHCVQYLTELENDLQAQNQINRKGPVVETMDRLATLISLSKVSTNFKPTYANQLLTDSLIKKLHHRRTRYGGNLRYCIRANAYCPGSLTPKACDPDAYLQFSALFDPILLNINRIDSFCHPMSPSYGHLRKTPNSQLLPVISYRVRFSRNLADYPFYPLMTKVHFQTIERRCKSVLLSWPDEPVGTYYTMEDIKAGKCRLPRKFLPNPNNSAQKVSGTERHWPHGRGIFVAHNNTAVSQLVVQVNIEDHLRVICLDLTGERLHEAYGRAVKMMQWLDKTLAFSKRTDYGFLSPIPFSVGTGLRVSALLSLPNLLSDKEALYQACLLAGVRVRPGDGIGTPLVDSICDVSPIAGLCVTEYKTVSLFPGQLKRLLLKETKTQTSKVLNNNCLVGDNNSLFRAFILGERLP